MTPIVLLHGFLGAGESWRRVLEKGPLLSTEVFQPDLPGHVGEPAPASFESALEELARRIARRFDRPALIAGYSLGARLALGLLCAHPGLCSAGLLIGVAPGLAGVERHARALADAELALVLRRQGLEAFLESWRRLPLFASQQSLPSQVLEEQQRINLGHQPVALAAALEAMSLGRMPDYRPQLAELAALGKPIELLVGAEDGKFLALAQEMQRKLPNARLEIVPGAGHNVMLEAPGAVDAALGRLAERGTK